MFQATALWAGGLAGALALIELGYLFQRPLPWRAGGWIIVLFGFDFAAGALVHGLLVELFKDVPWFTQPWPIVVAGLCGPALLRAQLALLGSGQEEAHYGPAVRFRRIQVVITVRINQSCAVAQSSWVSNVMSKIDRLPLNDIQLRASEYIKLLDNKSQPWKEMVLSKIESTAADTESTLSHRRRAIVHTLLDNDGRPCVNDLYRSAKKKN